MVLKKSVLGIDEAKWRAEEDMRTLTRAKEIEADRSRMAAAKRIAEQKIKEMQSVVAKKVNAPARKK
jgi:CRISPR/Cas system-associated endonuclease Cas1